MCVELAHVFEEKAVDIKRLCFRVSVSRQLRRQLLHHSNDA